MRKLKQFQIKARAPKEVKFGDFKIIEVNKKSKTAKADFGDGCVMQISIKNMMDQIAKYSPSRKTFYVSSL